MLDCVRIFKESKFTDSLSKSVGWGRVLLVSLDHVSVLFLFPQARRSETVLSVKKRALDQLEVWCRFTDVCNEGIELNSRSVLRFFQVWQLKVWNLRRLSQRNFRGNNASAALPTLEGSKLYASGSGDLPMQNSPNGGNSGDNQAVA